MKRFLLTRLHHLVLLTCAILAAVASIAQAQEAPRYVWTIVSIEPDKFPRVEVYDVETGALICNQKRDAHWSDVTQRRRMTLNEIATEKWNQDATINALRYWAHTCQNFPGFYYASQEDWFDGKRLVALNRRLPAGDDLPERALSAVKKQPSDFVK